MATTCQLCGRGIKLVRGLIAHHGYLRPQGWHSQTRSCGGARHRSFEVSCDLLPPAIAACERFIAAETERLHALINDPPDTLTIPARRDAYGNKRGEDRVLPRPAEISLYRRNMPGTYEDAWAREQLRLAGAITQATESLAYLRERLASWVAPAETKTA